MSLADDRIDDEDIGPLWAEHFPKIGDDRWRLVGSGFPGAETLRNSA